MTDNIPWIVKYRPYTLDDIIGQKCITVMLKNQIVRGDIPHMIFHGPSGVGKTSTIFAMANELFGEKIIKERVLELNASNERGINIVRNNIIRFAKMAINGYDSLNGYIPYKIVIYLYNYRLIFLYLSIYCKKTKNLIYFYKITSKEYLSI